MVDGDDVDRMDMFVEENAQKIPKPRDVHEAVGGHPPLGDGAAGGSASIGGEGDSSAGGLAPMDARDDESTKQEVQKPSVSGISLPMATGHEEKDQDVGGTAHE